MMLGAGEIVVVLAVALMVLGPKRMPEVARQIARMLGQLRRVSEELRAGVDDVLREDEAQRPPEPSFLQRLAEQARADAPAPPQARRETPEAAPQCDGEGTLNHSAPVAAEHVPYDQMFAAAPQVAAAPDASSAAPAPAGPAPASGDAPASGAAPAAAPAPQRVGP